MRADLLKRAVFIACLVWNCSAVFAQDSDLPADISRDLKSDNADVAIDAIGRLENSSEVFHRPGVKKKLLELLDQADREAFEALRDSNGQQGVGEGFGEYESYLAEAVTKIADWHDPHQVCIVAYAGYNPGSEFSVTLAANGGAAAVPCLLKLAKGVIYGKQYGGEVRQIYREQAISTLVEISALAKGLTPAEKRSVQTIVLEGLRDPTNSVREVTVQEVGSYGTPDSIPILSEIARSDPYSRPINEGRGRRYDVRELAKQAIDSIQKRAKAR